MRVILAAVAVLPLLAGCANDSLSNLDRRLGALVGVSEADLVRRVGTPTGTREADGQKLIAYNQLWLDWATFATPTPINQPWLIRGLLNRYCEITFAVTQGKVSGYRYEGDSCGWGGYPAILPA